MALGTIIAELAELPLIQQDDSSVPAGAEAQGSPVEQQRPARFHRPELDALRLVAFLMVWLAHSLPDAPELASHHMPAGIASCLLAVKDAGNFGVCVFFFLSAYLITELLRREFEVSQTISLPAFYARRVLRVWPLYLGVLIVYGVLGLRFHGFRIEAGRLLASVLLLGNWYIALHPAILTPMRALWSISVEEQFYLVWPLLFRSLRGRARSLAAIAVLALAAMATCLLALVLPLQTQHVTLWVNSFVQVQYFALGALAAFYLGGAVPRLSAFERGASACVAALLALVAAGALKIKRPLQPTSISLTGPLHHALRVHALRITLGYLLVGVACVLLFAAVLGLTRVPSTAIRLGKISFGLYVFHETGYFLVDGLMRRVPQLGSFAQQHWALALACNKAVALGLTILIAALSYRFWEKPFLGLKARFSRVPSRPA